ncbi:MAG: hypothetical protein JEZ11_14955 [Desulfobacterales bacterium]|nr:hypothetical protein [Desulfobacterales bacterium]
MKVFKDLTKEEQGHQIEMWMDLQLQDWCGTEDEFYANNDEESVRELLTKVNALYMV